MHPCSYVERLTQYNERREPTGPTNSELLETVRWALEQDDSVLVEVDGRKILHQCLFLQQPHLARLLCTDSLGKGLSAHLDMDAKHRARNLLVHFEAEE